MRLSPLLPFVAAAVAAAVPSYGSADPTLAVDYLAVRNLISSYPIAVDSKNATLLASLFTSSAQSSFTEPTAVINGSQAIAGYDLYAFQGLTTFHQLSTQLVEIAGNGVSGKAVTYFAATVFGSDCYAGQIVTAYGSYEDSVVKSNGVWQIQSRSQTYANPANPFVGNAAIVLGPKCNSTTSRRRL